MRNDLKPLPHLGIISTIIHMTGRVCSKLLTFFLGNKWFLPLVQCDSVELLSVIRAVQYGRALEMWLVQLRNWIFHFHFIEVLLISSVRASPLISFCSSPCLITPISFRHKVTPSVGTLVNVSSFTLGFEWHDFLCNASLISERYNPPIKKARNSLVQWHMPVIPPTQENEGGGWQVWGQLRKLTKTLFTVLYQIKSSLSSFSP